MNLTYNSTVVQIRKQDSAKRLNFYHDSQLTRLEEQLDELFSDPNSMIKVQLNVVKKVINNLAQTYREPPVRILEGGTEKDQDLYNQIIEDCQFDVKMKQASRYCKLLKTILIRPVWRNDKIDIDILTGNLLDVLTGDTPEKLLKVLVTNYGTSDNIEDVTYSLWSKDNWIRLDYRGNILEQELNPYKIIPFLPVFDFSPPSSGFWLPGGDDIISIQESINLKLTDLLYLIQNQSFGVGYLKSNDSGGSLRVDPGSFVQLGIQDEVGFINQQSEISQVVASIDKLVGWICVSNGLSASSMSTDPQTQC